MSVVIHHGHPGSYKSSGVIQNVVVDHLKSGRVLVTNIRGLDSLSKIEKAYSFRLPETCRIINIDTQGKEAKLTMAKWFHWAPKGALIVIDECQMIYPAKRKDFKLESLDYEGGPDKAAEDDRPADYAEAFDMHRHYNWDVYLCTPNIAKVHSEIRQVCEVAFRHYALGALIPWKKSSWREVEHDAENSGKAASHSYGSPKEYKADPRVFECYRSTATGKHKQSDAGNAFYKDKRVIFYFTVALLAICYFIYSAVQIATRSSEDEVVSNVDSIEGGQVDSDDSGLGGSVVSSKVLSVDSSLNHPFSGVVFYITGVVSDRYIFAATDDIGAFSFTSKDLASMGYTVSPFSNCFARIFYQGALVQESYCARSYDVIEKDNKVELDPALIDPFSSKDSA